MISAAPVQFCAAMWMLLMYQMCGGKARWNRRVARFHVNAENFRLYIHSRSHRDDLGDDN